MPNTLAHEYFWENCKKKMIMDYEKEIPFGAFDSDLMHEEISIPEGFEAEIKGNKIILKKTESEDEKVRKELITHCRNTRCVTEEGAEKIAKWIAFLEKQGEQKPRYSIGDVLCDKSCTTLNKDIQPNFEITDIRNGMYICDKCSFPISQQDEYELVAKRIEQEDTWTEEDKRILDALITSLINERFAGRLEFLKGIKVSLVIDWLKSLKEKIKKEAV